jgi:hypothetical protein
VFTSQAPNVLEICFDGTTEKIVIEKGNFPDVVVWNPHQEATAKITDLEPDDWKVFFSFSQVLTPLSSKMFLSLFSFFFCSFDFVINLWFRNLFVLKLVLLEVPSNSDLNNYGKVGMKFI